MNLRDGRTLSRIELQERRKAIVRLWKAGRSIQEIMDATGACYSTVYRIWHRWENEGHEAFKVHQPGLKKGQRRHLSAEQEESIYSYLIRSFPDELGIDASLWSRESVRRLIVRECGVEIPVRTIGEYLSRWDLRLERPMIWNGSNQSQRIRWWLEDTYPEIQKEAKARGASIFWVDEAKVAGDGARSSRAIIPPDMNPALHSPQGKDLRMIWAVESRGKRLWMLVEGAPHPQSCSKFMDRLLKETRTALFLIAATRTGPCIRHFESIENPGSHVVRVFSIADTPYNL